MARRSVLPVLGLVLLFSSGAFGQTRERTAADALFKEGRAAFDRGDYAQACAKFEASQTADPAIGTLLNLGVCEERLGKMLRARQHLGEFIRGIPAKDDRIPFAKGLADKVEQRIAHLTLTLAPGSPADVAVRDEGEARAIPVGSAVEMDPGDHELVVTAAGRPTVHLHVKLADGQSEQRVVALEAAPSVGPARPAEVIAPAPQSSSAPTRRTLGFVVGGLGVVGFVVAGITGGMLLGKKADVDAHCPDKRCDAEGVRLKTEAEGSGLLPVNTAAWVVGFAGVAAGAVLIITSRGSESKPVTALQVAPLAGGTGLAVRGAF